MCDAAATATIADWKGFVSNPFRLLRQLYCPFLSQPPPIPARQFCSRTGITRRRQPSRGVLSFVPLPNVLLCRNNNAAFQSLFYTK
jgi:hypothetical protein